MNVDTILTFLAVGGILWFFYGPWQALCVDFTRQFLFEQRDHLFDIALSERISFDDPNYLIMRKSIQTLIRFAHVMTMPRIVYLAMVFGGINSKGSGLRDAALAIEDPDLRREMIKIANNTALIVTASILMRSLVLFPAVPEAILAILILRTFDRCRSIMVQQLKNFGDLIQREAELTS